MSSSVLLPRGGILVRGCRGDGVEAAPVVQAVGGQRAADKSRRSQRFGNSCGVRSRCISRFHLLVASIGWTFPRYQIRRIDHRLHRCAGCGAARAPVPNAAYSASQLLLRREAAHFLLNRCRNAFFPSFDCTWLRFSPHTPCNAAYHPRDACQRCSGRQIVASPHRDAMDLKK